MATRLHDEACARLLLSFAHGGDVWGCSSFPYRVLGYGTYITGPQFFVSSQRTASIKAGGLFSILMYPGLFSCSQSGEVADSRSSRADCCPEDDGGGGRHPRRGYEGFVLRGVVDWATPRGCRTLHSYPTTPAGSNGARARLAGRPGSRPPSVGELFVRHARCRRTDRRH
jgi:hypothetical protein